MKRFYIITNEKKDVGNEVTNQIKSMLEAKGCTCILSQKDEKGYISKDTVPSNLDCGIVLGGDGTLIRAARELHDYDIPLIGVNLGTLGYLAEVERQNIGECLDELIADRGITENRMLLHGMVNDAKDHISLNDIVVTRLGELRIIHFDIYVNGELLNSYQADGVIVSTPTGSTGYNLSAGGPIVEPTASMFVITPICSHALNTSSIVLSAEDQIDIVIGKSRDGTNEKAGVSFDGAKTIELQSGDRVTVKRSKKTTRLLKLSQVSFLDTLRRKMKGN